uniref:IRF tryptophan pentad repeat domain-containing protein n=1 Tax=Ciona savignyi TaxID=51511 RepID=H2YHH2_CIOSA
YRMNGEDEYKLPLRVWLLKRLNQAKYPDVVYWTDKERGVFRILWTKKGNPNWKQHFQIFEDWAKHRDNFRPDSPINYDQLKSNFRNLIKKSSDFEELETVNNQQTGNCKVFRVRSPEEVKQLKKQSALSKARSQSSDASGSMDCIEASPSPGLAQLHIQENELLPNDTSLLNVQQQQNDFSTSSLNASKFTPSNLFSVDDLTKFQLIVGYKKNEVINTTIDLKNGHRLYHGNRHEIDSIAKMAYKTLDQNFFDIPVTELPACHFEDKYVSRMLAEFGFGIIFFMDDTNKTVDAARFCPLHVFYHDTEGLELTNLERSKGEEVKFKPIFSYVDVIQALWNYNRADKSKKIPTFESSLMIGTRKNLISVELRPIVGDALSEALLPGSECLSTSNKDSVDLFFEFLKGS